MEPFYELSSASRYLDAYLAVEVHIPHDSPIVDLVSNVGTCTLHEDGAVFCWGERFPIKEGSHDDYPEDFDRGSFDVLPTKIFPIPDYVVPIDGDGDFFEAE